LPKKKLYTKLTYCNYLNKNVKHSYLNSTKIRLMLGQILVTKLVIA